MVMSIPEDRINLGMRRRPRCSAAEVRSTILVEFLELEPSHHQMERSRATPHQATKGTHRGSSLDQWWSLLSLGLAGHHRRLPLDLVPNQTTPEGLSGD
uniref:Uncharacterized protein n=1 Tax=Arundo donax TaxID=35708 RepID=A0A0A9D9E8_ARUDO